MAEQGTAALSLRAVARQMGVTGPAIYRYFASRDDLLTTLLLDAYTDMADALEAARDAAFAACAAAGKARDDSYAEVYLYCVEAYRAWALEHPIEYQLIQGNPIPGYHAPNELTQPAARRAMQVLVGLVSEAWRRGRLSLPKDVVTLFEERPDTRALAQRLAEWRAYEHYDAPLVFMHMALTTWAKLHGLITLELFGHLQPIIGDPGDLYHTEALAQIAYLHLGEPAPVPTDEPPLT